MTNEELKYLLKTEIPALAVLEEDRVELLVFLHRLYDKGYKQGYNEGYEDGRDYEDSGTY